MTDIPEGHYTRVGRVAVTAAQLEEAGAGIVYASEGGWDMSTDHLRFAGSKQGLLGRLREVVVRLPADLTTKHWPRRDGQPGMDERTGVVRIELAAYVDEVDQLLERRDRIVHSTPWEDVFSGSDVEVIHPRALRQGSEDARGPLPANGEVEALVGDLTEAIRRGWSLAGRVAATLHEEGVK